MLRSHLAKKKTIKEVGIAKITLAICITERRLRRLNEILKEPIIEAALVSNDEWEVLSCHRMIEAKLLREKFPALKRRIEALYMKYRRGYKEAKSEDEAIEVKIRELLEGVKARYPQYELNGARNIWIVKPAGLSRGRGIHMFSDLKKLLDFIKGKHYVVQKYIENPLIVLNRKVTLFHLNPSSTFDNGY